MMTYHLSLIVFEIKDEKYYNFENLMKPEALKSLYRSPGYKKKQLALCKNYVLQW
jgi:hypothetical protein